MILNEKELYDLRKEKRILFANKKKPEKKPEKTDNLPLIASSLHNLFGLINSFMKSFEAKFSRLEQKLSSLNTPKQQVEPEKKTDAWDFKVIRDIDSRISKIEARRK